MIPVVLLRRSLVAAIGVGIVLVVVTVRVGVAGVGELRQARAFDRRGLWPEAIVHYRRAARWYAPGAPWVGASLERLLSIGRDAEEREDRATALSAYRAVRGAIRATRSVYTPSTERLAAADERIATLMAEEPPAPADAQKSVGARRQMHARLLARDESPRVVWTLVMLAGFVAWMGGAFAFIFGAIGEDDRIRTRPAWWWGGCTVGGFLLWMLGLWLV